MITKFHIGESLEFPCRLALMTIFIDCPLSNPLETKRSSLLMIHLLKERLLAPLRCLQDIVDCVRASGVIV